MLYSNYSIKLQPLCFDKWSADRQFLKL